MINRTLTLLIGLIIVGTSHILSASDSKEATQKLTRAELLDKLRKKTNEKAQDRMKNLYHITEKDRMASMLGILTDQERVFVNNNPKIIQAIIIANPQLTIQAARDSSGPEKLQKLIQIAMREHPDKVTRP